MKKNIVFLSVLWLLVIINTSCEEKVSPINQDISVVSQFVYDGMSAYYYWNEEMINKKPSVNDSDPVKYFESLLSGIDTHNGWSWITNDVNALSNEFEGKSLSFGYNLGFTKIENEVYAFIKYVHANTPAEKAGLQRLDLIGKLNDQPITTKKEGDTEYISEEDINLLYGSNTVKFTIYRFSENGTLKQYSEKTITPDNSAKDPVLFDTIFTIGDKKIGYLFYTDFYANFNYRLYEVFNRFKLNGVTDLVLDLRYNTGGSVSAAIYLASLIAPKTVVENKSPYIVMDYNNIWNTLFDEWYKEAKPADKYKYDRKEYLGVFDSAEDKNPLEANLDLNKVYIIATGNSYSASELTTFCLEPYMNVVHIGSNTGGKYTASWTVHAYDGELGMPVYEEKELTSTEKNELKNWAMQPIVAIYSDKDSKNFSNAGYLVPDYKLQEGFGYLDYWTALGDSKDVLLGQALYLITGDNSYSPVQPRSSFGIQSTNNKIINPIEEGKPVVLEHIQLTTDDFKQLKELQK